jgi:hypothetical protein
MAEKPLMLLPPSALLGTKVKRRGHAGHPGRGPEGETCRSCASLTRTRMANTYLKCLLSRARWTGGGATDVRAKDPACEFWTAKAKSDG